LKNGFCELSFDEMEMVDGGGWGDFFEKINPLNLIEFTYKLGQDLGASSVKFGRECYDFYEDVKKIF
jgi:hypothetical protein